ncbi:hypothetical protein H6P81_006536 [Aristolochia fimbriata]|uniref:Uncharacterized protein n=1 Tax=Aristolochia fimbriata TaxID=158543 RepID=A0AAV7F1G6_ARIFI|nr:hypothetical protein H6P81_006536 [Aristolochia fimbriata]
MAEANLSHRHDGHAMAASSVLGIAYSASFSLDPKTSSKPIIDLNGFTFMFAAINLVVFLSQNEGLMVRHIWFQIGRTCMVYSILCTIASFMLRTGIDPPKLKLTDYH